MEDPTKKYIQLQIETLKKTLTELQATVDEIDSSQDTTAKSTESSHDPDIESANVAKVDVNSSNSTATLQTEDQTLSNASEDTQDDTKVKSTESSNDPVIGSANVAKVDVNSSNSTATLQTEDQTLSNASEDTQDDTTAKSTESSNDPDIESANVAKVDVNSSNSTATLQTEDQTLSNAPEDTQDDTKVKSTESSNDPDIESANVAKVDVNSSNSTATLQTEDQTLSNASEDTQDDTTVKFTESSCLDDPDIGSANVAKVGVNSSNVTATLQDEDQTQKEAILSPLNLAGATEDGQDITDTEMNQDVEESTDAASVCEADLNPHSRHEQMMCNLTKEISSLEALGICNEGISVVSPEQFTIDKFDFDDSSESSSMQTASSTMNCNLGILGTNLEAIVRYYSSFWDLMINNQTPGKTVLLQYEKWHGVEPNLSMRKKKLGRLFKPNGKIPGKQLLETKRSVEVKLGVTFHSLLHFLLSIDAIDNFGYGSKVLISEQTELEWEEMNEVEQTAVNWAASLLVDMRSLAQRRQRNAIRASKELKRKCCDLSV